MDLLLMHDFEKLKSAWQVLSKNGVHFKSG